MQLEIQILPPHFAMLLLYLPSIRHSLLFSSCSLASNIMDSFERYRGQSWLIFSIHYASITPRTHSKSSIDLSIARIRLVSSLDFHKRKAHERNHLSVNTLGCRRLPFVCFPITGLRFSAHWAETQRLIMPYYCAAVVRGGGITAG